MGPVNASELEWEEVDRGETAFRRTQLGEAAGGDLLGCSLYELPAGRKSWPYHYHAGNEEALYVLDGTGTLRLDGTEYDIEAGVYAAFPAEQSGSHQVRNDSEGPLRYLLVSTMDDPDVTVYPDSGTFGVFVGSPPGSRDEGTLHGFYEIDGTVDYWDE